MTENVTRRRRLDNTAVFVVVDLEFTWLLVIDKQSSTTRVLPLGLGLESRMTRKAHEPVDSKYSTVLVKQPTRNYVTSFKPDWIDFLGIYLHAKRFSCVKFSCVKCVKKGKQR